MILSLLLTESVSGSNIPENPDSFTFRRSIRDFSGSYTNISLNSNRYLKYIELDSYGYNMKKSTQQIVPITDNDVKIFINMLNYAECFNYNEMFLSSTGPITRYVYFCIDGKKKQSGEFSLKGWITGIVPDKYILRLYLIELYINSLSANRRNGKL